MATVIRRTNWMRVALGYSRVQDWSGQYSDADIDLLVTATAHVQGVLLHDSLRDEQLYATAEANHVDYFYEAVRNSPAQ